MARSAYIFPGQGSQFAGMGKDLFERSSAARMIFEEADDAVGFKLSEMCFSGSEEDLQLTANTQPAILTASIAAYRAMEESGWPKPDIAAGHSLGEYAALVSAGVLDFSDAVRTVRKRGTYMQEAVPPGVGAMAAVLGLDSESVAAGCAEASQGLVCSPANINSPSQTVIAGHSEAVDRACEILKAMGAKRAIRLNVSAPFHCSLMRPAEEQLEVDLAALDYAVFAFPIVHNVDARSNSEPSLVPEKLKRQVSSPVRWLESVRQLTALGVDTFVEVGPGKVLTGLVRQIDREVRCVNVGSYESLSSMLETL